MARVADSSDLIPESSWRQSIFVGRPAAVKRFFYMKFENWDAKLTGSNQLGKVDYIPRAYCSWTRQHQCCQFDLQDQTLIRLQFQTLNRVAIHLSHYSLLYYLFLIENGPFRKCKKTDRNRNQWSNKTVCRFYIAIHLE